MGNKKIAKNTHVSNGKYRKKKFQPKKRQTQPPTQESSRPHVVIEGARIVNISQLEKYISDITIHVAQCATNTTGKIVLIGEKRDGLSSIISTECSACGYIIKLETSRKVKCAGGHSRWECNLAAVWGQMSTGGGHSTLTESMGMVGVPVMTKRTFMATERTIGEWWRERLHQSMIDAGKQEKQLAMDRGDFHEGVPAITVIVDGGWSKRSHRHSYNAKSGVGIIIGLETNKLLHVSVCNNYCAACATGIPKDHHSCYHNWEDSSSGMETDTILEGFLEAEKVHGLRYTRFIGDGDSSVYPTLLQSVPGWGRAIKKMECANHACKYYRSSLEKLANEHPEYKGKGGLTLHMRKRLTSAARCAIKMRSKEQDTSKSVKLLEQDLKNGPNHCFGIHTNCSSDFCTHKSTQAQHSHHNTFSSPSSSDTCDESIGPDVVQDIAQTQEQLWLNTVNDSETTENDVRLGGSTPTNVNPKLLLDIQVLVSRLVAKAGQLVGNFTTNLVENWMSIRCKFDGGKVVNRSQSGSWEYRCMGAGLRMNLGPRWSPEAWEDMTGSSPNHVLKDTTNHAARKYELDRKRKASETAKEKRRRTKYARTNDDTANARRAYNRRDGGVEPMDVVDDISKEYLCQLKETYYATNVVVSKEKAGKIEEETRMQGESVTWKEERKKRITASKVGGIAKMRKTTKRAGKVEDILYSKFRGNTATRYGLVMEEECKKQYITQQSHSGRTVDITPVGLCISTENPWIAASPDSLVTDPGTTPPHGLLEMKNPYTGREMTVQEYCKVKSSCLEEKRDGKITLRHGHDYYYQVQCQMYCTGREWCDFVVQTNKDIHIERICRDRKWWELQLEKCQQFYFGALLPELASPRFGKGGIREPNQPPP